MVTKIIGFVHFTKILQKFHENLTVSLIMNFYPTFCVFLMQITITLAISLDWLKNTKVLKDRLKQFYHKTFVSKNDSVSVDQRPFGPLDYPGNDTKKLNTIENIWNEYYDCLGTKASSLNALKIVPPYAVAAFAETSIT